MLKVINLTREHDYERLCNTVSEALHIIHTEEEFDIIEHCYTKNAYDIIDEETGESLIFKK